MKEIHIYKMAIMHYYNAAFVIL